ncbi:alpha/beta hydrolase [Pedobacter sp. MC2016-15]|uniref:alpha/beta hydrolase family protein n=1 Tax=Pedobacter sp. MC2016-15 TaxID=2994473 RepID=UPI002245FE8E|nr:alpha/beta fold hydrolase [Pedobacter sp. MC2016-15]MCX2481480.1 alpha/beta hydrolase [Pedobacter sp. MC2016-15]
MKPFLILLLSFAGYSVSGQTTISLSIDSVRFSSSGVTLAGTIFKPQRPFAAIVLVHGSGQETRMLQLAEHLAGRGIAVLTYDKRGVGKSGGVYAGPEVGTNNIDAANLRLLASDVNAACGILKTFLKEARLPMGLMGFSQAGWIIPLAAQNDSSLRFMVIFSGAVVTTLEQLRFQFYTKSNPKFWDTHTEDEVREHVLNDADRYQFTATDPQEALLNISVPGFWIFGGRDVQVPVALSIAKLNVLKAEGKHYDLKFFPELGHNTAFSKSQEPMEAALRWVKSKTSDR